MSELSVFVCRVKTPEDTKDYVTLVPPEMTVSQGLTPKAIVGVLLHPLGPGEPITPENFSHNPVFVEFMHEVIARHAPKQPTLLSEARRLGNGWVYIIDQRTRIPNGPVPSEDIIGAFEVKNGVVIPESYQRSYRHRILSLDGFFRLDVGLHQCLLQELSTRNAER